MIHLKYKSANSQLSYRFLLIFLLFSTHFLHGQPRPVHIDSVYTYPEILSFLQQGLQQNDATLQGKAYCLLAKNIHNRDGDEKIELDYLLKSHSLLKNATDEASLNQVKLYLSEVYARLNLYEQSIELQQQVLIYAQKEQNLYLETHTLSRLAETFFRKKDFLKYQEYQQKTRKNNLMLKDTVLEISCLKQDIMLLQGEEKYSEAFVLAQKMTALGEAKRLAMFSSTGYFYQGILLQFQGKFQAAIPALQQAIATIEQPEFSGLLRQCYLHLATCYANLKDYKKAYYFENQYNTLNNKILDNQRQTSLQNLTIQYDSEEKRQMIEHLEREKSEAENRAAWQKRLNIGMTIGLVSLALGLFFMLYTFRQNKKKNKLITEQKEHLNQQKINELEQEIKLANINAIVKGQETERERIAKDLHDSLGGMLATVRLRIDALPTTQTAQKESTLQLLDHSVQEIRRVARNLQPDALLQFGLVKAVGDFINQLKGNEVPLIIFQHYGEEKSLNPTANLSLFRVIQELLNNAIKHAQATEILVEINYFDNEIAVTIEDDGIGYDHAAQHNGMGLGNINHRIAYLNAAYEVQSQPGQGTSCMVRVEI